MQVEWLIFFYIGVSVAMAFFDLGFAAFEHTRDVLFKRETQRMALSLNEEIVLNAKFPTAKHKHRLTQRLKRLPALEAFDLTMQQFRGLDEENAEMYLLGIGDVFERLALFYQQKKPLNKAYYAYILKRWYRTRPASPAIVHTLMLFVEQGTVFLRQNAFEALAQLEDVDVVVRAIKLLDDNSAFHHPKLITETVLIFAGDKDALADALAADLDDFSPATQCAIINFLRMRHRGDRAHLLETMKDDQIDREIRLACVRYFMTNPWSQAESVLRTFAQESDSGEWEYASVAASALAAYPGPETIELLKGLLTSPVWYVRYNAAKSLYDLGATLEADLADVLEGDDRYAREMVQYRWDFEEASEA